MNLYNVKLNYKGEVHDIHTMAVSHDQAKEFAIQRVAKALQLRKTSPIKQFIKGGPGRIESKFIKSYPDIEA